MFVFWYFEESLRKKEEDKTEWYKESSSALKQSLNFSLNSKKQRKKNVNIFFFFRVMRKKEDHRFQGDSWF